MKKVLFVCIENSNRSQMAQAFARIHGSKKVIAYSAGSKPSGKINPKAIAAMLELGYDLRQHQSKSLDEIPKEHFDYVITMGCGDACPFIPASHREDWAIPDPREMDEKQFRGVRDLIEQKVVALLKELNEGTSEVR
jgi:arsenate reductase (thioredoxin)